MDTKKHSYYFLLFALIISCLIVYFIAEPFLGSLILASIFAFLFQPIYKKCLNYITLVGDGISSRCKIFDKIKRRENVGALTTTLVAIILVIVPLTFLGMQIFKESSDLYESLLKGGGDFERLIGISMDWIRITFPVQQGFEFDFGHYIKQGLMALVQNLGLVFSSFTKILLNIFVFLIAFYFFLKDGAKLKNYFVALSPLSDMDDEFVVSRIKSSVSSAIKGSLTIGLIQGTLTGIGFAIFGVPNPALWGGVAVVASFLPGIGTILVIAPAIVYLFLFADNFSAIGLLIWGVTAVGLIDNFLGPKLIGRGMQLHPLVVFIAVLGGIVFFGPLGFILGPLAVSICLALIDIYFSLKNKNCTG